MQLARYVALATTRGTHAGLPNNAEAAFVLLDCSPIRRTNWMALPSFGRVRALPMSRSARSPSAWTALYDYWAPLRGGQGPMGTFVHL